MQKFILNTLRFFATRSCALLFITLWSQAALAVVVVEVETRDVPTVRSGSVSFTDVDGQDRDATVRYSGGITVIEIDGPADKIKGGELNVKPADGTPRFSSVIPMGWDGNKPLRLDMSRNVITDAPAGPRLYAGVNWDWVMSLGDGEQDIPEWGPAAGIIRSPGDEVRALPSDDERSVKELGFKLTGPDIQLGFLPAFRIYGSYQRSSSDDDGARSVPIGTVNGFGVFDAISPTLGTGISTGMSGLDAAYEVDWDRDEYQIGATWRATSDFLGDIAIDPRIGVFWGDEEVDWQSSTIFPAFPNLSIRTDREIDADFWGVEIGADFEKPIGAGFSLNLGAGVIYQDRDATLTSHADINLLGTPETVDHRSTESDSDVGARFSVGVSYDPNDRLRIGLHHIITTGVGNLGGTGGVDGDDITARMFAMPATEEGLATSLLTIRIGMF